MYDDPVINNDPLTEDDFATDYRFDLVGNRREKLTDTAPTAAAFTAYREGGNLTPDQAIKYAYDDNDRLLTELAQSIAADGARTTEQTTWHEYDPDTDGQPGTGGSWTMETRKTVFQGGNTSEGRVIVSDAKYSFNLQNRLAQAEIDTNGATAGGVETSQYEYNTSGIRVQKVEGTDKVLYLVDGNNPTGYAQVLEELNGAHQLQRAYTLGLDVISQAEAAGPVYHLLYDGHGSTRALLNGSGVIIGGQTFAYDAYGNAIGFNPALVLTTLLYSGEQFDQRLQMQYLRARYYDLATGRFNRLDPFFGNLRDPLSLHKYFYVHGDPVRNADPSGLLLSSFNLAMGIAARITIGAATFAAIWVLAAPRIAMLGATVNLRPLATSLQLKIRTRSEIKTERNSDPQHKWFVHGSSSGFWPVIYGRPWPTCAPKTPVCTNRARISSFWRPMIR